MTFYEPWALFAVNPCLPTYINNYVVIFNTVVKIHILKSNAHFKHGKANITDLAPNSILIFFQLIRVNNLVKFKVISDRHFNVSQHVKSDKLIKRLVRYEGQINRKQ